MSVANPVASDSHGNVDEQISQLMQCKPLSELEVHSLPPCFSLRLSLLREPGGASIWFPPQLFVFLDFWVDEISECADRDIREAYYRLSRLSFPWKWGSPYRCSHASRWSVTSNWGHPVIARVSSAKGLGFFTVISPLTSRCDYWCPRSILVLHKVTYFLKILGWVALFFSGCIVFTYCVPFCFVLKHTCRTVTFCRREMSTFFLRLKSPHAIFMTVSLVHRRSAVRDETWLVEINTPFALYSTLGNSFLRSKGFYNVFS